jgi:cysteinyl-tRNA synthetase
VTLRLYNTATRKKEEFEPLEKGKIGLYLCGVTVYDLCHIGHARSAIVFDVLVRYLRARGYQVTFVRNFTDVDDKIIEKSRTIGKETDVVAGEYIDAFYEDMERLGVMRADHEPRATEHIQGMIEMISRLIDLGYAYVEESDVFFSVEKLEDYGALSGRRLEEMQAGSRIAVDSKKRHPMDFVLWKGAKPGEPHWSSPWGEGRPGWHIECSVMSNRFLGPTFDIHGGGKDLLFPHHENERAQSVAAGGGRFARYWVHNGFVTIDSEKMSKSLGNFLTIRDALKEYHPEVLRLFLLSKHYRSPLDFSADAVTSFQSGLTRAYRTLQKLQEILGFPNENGGETLSLKDPLPDEGLDGFVQNMDDDLNTAAAVGQLFEKVKEINKQVDQAGLPLSEEARRILENERRLLLTIGRILGLLMENPSTFFEELSDESVRIDPQEVERLIQERVQARKEKNWARADDIRKGLKEKGVILEDGPQGTGWRLDV